jgi:hypothetical protein
MTNEELSYLKALFEKRDKLQLEIDRLYFPSDAKFVLKSVVVEVKLDNINGWQTKVFNDLPISSNELRHFYSSKKNGLMYKLNELNHQIEKIKITP